VYVRESQFIEDVIVDIICVHKMDGSRSVVLNERMVTQFFRFYPS